MGQMIEMSQRRKDLLCSACSRACDKHNLALFVVQADTACSATTIADPLNHVPLRPRSWTLGYVSAASLRCVSDAGSSVRLILAACFVCARAANLIQHLRSFTDVGLYHFKESLNKEWNFTERPLRIVVMLTSVFTRNYFVYNVKFPDVNPPKSVTVFAVLPSGAFPMLAANVVNVGVIPHLLYFNELDAQLLYTLVFVDAPNK